MQEIYDGEPVMFYRAKFNGVRFGLDPEWAESETQIGRLPILLVAARIGKPVYDDDKDGDRFKEVTFRVEEVVPLQDALKRQAMTFMAHEGDDGVLDFPVSEDTARLRQALNQQDRLQGYIEREWGVEVRDGETPVEAAIRLLEEYRGAEVPSERDDEEGASTVDEDDQGPAAPAMAPQPAQPVKSIVPPIPPEDEMEPRPRNLHVAPFDADDADGFETHRDLGPTGGEVVGSVHRSDTSETRKILDEVFN